MKMQNHNTEFDGIKYRNGLHFKRYKNIDITIRMRFVLYNQLNKL